MGQCHNFGGNQAWSLTGKGEIENDELCLEATSATAPVKLNTCHRRKEHQEWRYHPDTKQLEHVILELCLTADVDPLSPDTHRLVACSSEDLLQRWELGGYKD